MSEPLVPEKSDPVEEKDLSIIEVILVLVIAWILVDLWTKVIHNLFYSTFHFNPNSFYISLLVALLFTGIFFAFIFTSKTGVQETVTSTFGELL